MKNILWAIGMAVSLAAFGGVMVFANLGTGRTDAELAIADRCVLWTHQPKDTQRADAVLASQCDTYFRVRTEHDSDEDDARWAKHVANDQRSASGH